MDLEENSEFELENQDISGTPPVLIEMAKQVQLNLLPQKSKKRYELMYDAFTKWQKEYKTTSVSERTLTAYFQGLAEKYKPSTLWSRYSMLRTMIFNRRNENIDTYSSLIAFLKNQAIGFKSKKALVFTPENLKRFFEEAPDQIYLASKVIAIFGIQGATRNDELVNMQKSYVTHANQVIIVKIPTTKTYVEKTFTIEGDLAEIVRKYESLRPANATTTRYFVNYQNGKCTQQVIGTNKFAKTPKQIATYLGLEEPSRYTGHSFRRTSTTILADNGADITLLKRHGLWKSNTVAEGYIQESINNKRKIGNMISDAINYEATTCALPAMVEGPNKTKKQKTSPSTEETIANDAIGTLVREGAEVFQEEQVPVPTVTIVINEESTTMNNNIKMSMRQLSEHKIKSAIFNMSNCNVTINMISNDNNKENTSNVQT
ncbi:hypothetical protein ABEB36_009244 [Hypothenemus hampei]|uniref:Tyr recombinase domain-containing protein n=1 Tax=Hypothenemus hampei TaxID=57062 RepID=A0ABD1EIN5_HYPHA